MQAPDLIEISRELTQQHQPHAWITVISVNGPSSSYVGAQAIVRSDGELKGWIGGGCVQSAARAAALRSIASAVPQRLRLSNTTDPSDDVDVRPMACASNGEVELFIQPTAIAPRLRIYGSTPIVAVTAWLAREMDFDPLTDTEAADVEALTQGRASERETYALVATQGDGDESALEKALLSNAKAVLVVASRRKAERLRMAMELRGVPKARLDIMHAPAGPDIGAITPNEIALATVAGLIALRRGRAAVTCPHANSTENNERVRPAAPPATGYINPVCGAVVDPKHAMSTLTMAGQTHYFCCQGCRTEFERDPQKYLDIAAHMREPARTSLE
jgi:xanthine dehydrogenase accessory factor